jgi:hypothetical protein
LEAGGERVDQQIDEKQAESYQPKGLPAYRSVKKLSRPDG